VFTLADIVLVSSLVGDGLRHSIGQQEHRQEETPSQLCLEAILWAAKTTTSIYLKYPLSASHCWFSCTWIAAARLHDTYYDIFVLSSHKLLLPTNILEPSCCASTLHTASTLLPASTSGSHLHHQRTVCQPWSTPSVLVGKNFHCRVPQSVQFYDGSARNLLYYLILSLRIVG